ncbi:hypothetical protein DUNSADRAFT_6516 [Dunaliella salina]|uniref:Uncharacterized protein n=1 Tax=Dunaliella salina TaxID=3046 RepID=A0ABQ7GN70_DUNSA|nr:hypothetical protein DUNSADRAFT_6516 [Dunaliella salina]|eukprot:KAF5836046.1 hypothetical protein DUNSADRAFT_6516 [Dunaliella salina]
MSNTAQPRAWVAAIQIEKRLRAELKKNSFWHRTVRELRTALHHAYESTIFADFQFAQANEVEQQLWKSCFYKPIEEFRSRLRVAQQAAQGVTALAGATPEEALEQSAMLTTAYTKFLASAEEAYKRLVARLQWELGDVGAAVEVPSGEMQALQQAAPPSAGKGNTAIATAVHRCLIYLGDICRYRSQVVRPKEEQERALAYYQQAASVLPTSGNPYNQMAVVAYYGSDELRAVYYYFRSLGVSCPFVTARENLLLLFERNRARYAKLPPRPPGPGQGITPGDVATRMVRLAGLMFDRINLEQLTPTRAAAIAALRQLLGE